MELRRHTRMELTSGGYIGTKMSHKDGADIWWYMGTKMSHKDGADIA